MSMNKKKVSVFIASPGDVSKERQIFRNVIEDLNSGFAEGADVRLEGLGWEDSLATTGRRCQSVINENIDNCNVFIMLLHMRWGQEVEKDNPFSSYTEEEFHRALSRLNSDNPPEIYVFFKEVEKDFLTNPDSQLHKVLKFKEQLISTNNVLFRSVNEQNFYNEITNHLKSYIKGRRFTNKSDEIIFPVEAIEKVERLKQEKYSFENTYAIDSFEFAQLGKKGVKSRFIKIMQEFKSPESLLITFEYFFNIGDLVSCEKILNKIVLQNAEVETVILAKFYLNIGRLFHAKSDFDSYKNCIEKSLNFYKLINNNHGIASCLLELGNIYDHIGNLELAEKFYLDAKKLFQYNNDELNIARCYINMSDLYLTRGDHKLCAEYINNALVIFEKGNDLEGLILSNEKLGHLVSTNDKKEAIKYYNNALNISKKLEYKSNIAAQNINIGNLLDRKNESEEALDYYNRALKIYEDLNDLFHIGITYGAISNTYFITKDLNKSIDFNNKAINIFLLLKHEKALLKCIYHQSTCFFMQGNGIEALDLLNQYLPRFTKLEYKQGVASIYLLKGHILLNEFYYLKTNELLKESEYNLKFSYSLFQKLNDLSGIFNSAGLLKNLYDLTNDKQNSDKFKDIMKNIPDEFKNYF